MLIAVTTAVASMRSKRKLTAEKEDSLKGIYSSFEYGAAYTNPYKLCKIANREIVHVQCNFG